MFPFGVGLWVLYIYYRSANNRLRAGNIMDDDDATGADQSYKLLSTNGLIIKLTGSPVVSAQCDVYGGRQQVPMNISKIEIEIQDGHIGLGCI